MLQVAEGVGLALDQLEPVSPRLGGLEVDDAGVIDRAPWRRGLLQGAGAFAGSGRPSSGGISRRGGGLARLGWLQGFGAARLERGGLEEERRGVTDMRLRHLWRSPCRPKRRASSARAAEGDEVGADCFEWREAMARAT